MATFSLFDPDMLPKRGSPQEGLDAKVRKSGPRPAGPAVYRWLSLSQSVPSVKTANQLPSCCHRIST